MTTPSQPQGQSVDLSSLSFQQLSSVKKQLDNELEHLTSSFQKLRAAQTMFQECLKSIRDGVSAKTKGKPVLVPLTTSLYVPGTLADVDMVILDVGTGFYVEKTTNDAVTFYKARIDGLNGNLKDLESLVQGKSNNLRIVEDILRQKVITSNNNNDGQ